MQNFRGEIQFNSDEKKSKNPFRYVLIQELGEQNFLEHFLEFSQTDAVYEKDVIKFLIQAAEVLVEIHKGMKRAISAGLICSNKNINFLELEKKIIRWK
jgi:hypothetical protein